MSFLDLPGRGGEMLQFAYPWILALLPLPLLVWWLSPAHRESRPALQVPFLDRLARLTGSRPTPGAVERRRPAVAAVTIWAFWACFVVALARPQRVEAPVVKTTPTRDLLLAVDLSGSMETADMTDTDGNRIDRLTAVKQVLDEFLTRREGDRVGLIFFGNAPFVQAPFTEDLEVCRVLLDEAQVRMAGPRTMLGDAIGKAVSVFDESELEEKVLILLTDGNDTGSLVPPVKAAEIARDRGIVIHPIAMGDPTATGEEAFDEETLKAVAETTGGRYFRAADRETLEGVYAEIDRLSSHEVESVSYRPVTDLFQWPLGAALVLSVVVQGGLLFRYRTRRESASRFPTHISAAASVVVLIAALGSLCGAAASSGEGFHFLRPEWLLLVLPAGLVLYLTVRKEDVGRSWRKWVNPVLLRALLSTEDRQRSVRPVHLLGALWLVGILALAGPSWRREASPFAEDQAALVIALKVTPSMQQKDVAPSRLERSVQKISDILDRRAGARTGLIAYAGSAHLVMPLTSDASILNTFAEALQPELIPVSGDDAPGALELAQRQLDQPGQRGAILFVADAMNETAIEAFESHRRSGKPPVHVLAALPTDPELQTDPSALNLLQRVARAGGGSFTAFTPDRADVEALARRVQQTATSSSPGGADRWRDDGYWLLPLVGALGLFWFRRGWVLALQGE